MVKRAYFKSVLRTIKRSLGRFIAIFTIVALGVGFLAGLLASSPDMRYSVQLYYADTRFMDVRVIGNLGLTDKDVSAVSALECVDRVMPSHSRDLLAQAADGDIIAVRVHSTDFSNRDEAVNLSVLVEGRWPSAPDECVIEDEMGLMGALAIGETLSFTVDNKDLDDFLSVKQYKITGIVSSSYYLNMSQRGSASVGSGRLGAIAYLPLESFCADYYTDIFATLKGSADLQLFSDEYTALSDSGISAIEQLSETQKYVRRDDIRADAERELQDARKKLDEETAKARRELDDARAELEDGEAQLSDAEQKLQDGQKEYDDGVAALARSRRDFEREITENRAKLDDGLAQIGSALAQLDEGWTALQAGELEFEQNLAQWQSADDEISMREIELAQADAELSAGEAEIAEAREQLALLRAQLDAQIGTPAEQSEQYIAARAQLEQSTIALDAQSAPLIEARALLDAGLAQIAQARLELDAALPALEAGAAELAQSRQQLEQSQAVLDAELLALTDAQAQLDTGRVTANREFASAQRKLDSAKAELEDGQKEIAENRVKLEDGWAEYYDGERKADEALLDANDKITEAEDKIRDIEEPKWYVLARDTNAGYVSYESDSDKIAAIARVFPIFFFLVAALVASTTMTRMVDEERAQIGTLKAVGYSDASIAMKYFSYAGIAAILGCAAGLAAGLSLFPHTIYNAYGMIYSLPEKVAADHFTYGTLASCAIFVAIMLATAGALKSSLNECAASLMRPKAPKEGKRIFLERITPLWRRMKFTHKVTARNLLRYKKRFFMTVIGIFGCTALILCGFGLRDSISDIVDVQFGELFTYSFTAGLKHQGDQLSDRRISAVLEDGERVYDYTAANQQGVTISANGKSRELTLTVPQYSDEITKYITFRERVGRRPVAFGEGSVLLSEKTALTLGLHAGDTFTLENSDGEAREFVLSAIIENYVSAHIYMTAETYAAAFGEPPEYLMLFAHSRDENAQIRDEISSALLASPNITSVGFVAGISEGFDEMLGTIDYIIVIITVSAGLLAFVVMYNLTNINIAEREKELATVKVLGFTSLETAMYIFRETIILTLVGALSGLGGGVLLHRYIISTVEVDNMMFGRVVRPESYLISFTVTLAFSIFVSLVMSVKMRKISMADSLKAPE